MPRPMRGALPVSRAEWEPLLTERLGLDTTARRWDVCEDAIRVAMRASHAADAAAFRLLVERDVRAFQLLVEALTVGETYFFRDPAQFEFLRTRAIPELVAGLAPDAPLRIWSAGCATGEEPYSVAMLLDEMGLAARGWILGTDVSEERLARARHARYTSWSMRGVSASRVDRFFRIRNGRYELIEAIRRTAEFRQCVFGASVQGAPDAPLHVILCRNVLIYLDRPTIARTADELLTRLAPGGWLLTGPSDPLLPHGEEWSTEQTEAGIVYQRLLVPRSGSCIGPAARGGSPVAARAAAGRAAAPRPAPVVARRTVIRAERPVPAPPPAPPAAAAAEGLLARARARAAARDFAQAAELSRLYLDREPAANVEAWIILVRSLANLRQAHVALRACTAAMGRHPQDAELAVLAALLMTELAQHEASVRAARRAVYLDREHPLAHLALGTALAKAGHPTEARRPLAHALRLLQALEPSAIVPGTGGESAARLASVARSHVMLLGGDAA